MALPRTLSVALSLADCSLGTHAAYGRQAPCAALSAPVSRELNIFTAVTADQSAIRLAIPVRQ
jgi:hypothetical protein